MHHVHHSNTSNSNRCTHIYAPLCFRCMVNQYCNCNVCIYICQTVENCLHILYYMYICTCTYTYPKALRLVTPCIFVHVYVTLSTSAAIGQLLILIKIAMVRMYVLHDHNAPLLPSGTFPLKFANH